MGGYNWRGLEVGLTNGGYNWGGLRSGGAYECPFKVPWI